MKKKVKGSSWRYNPGIARPWLNEGDEESESQDEFSVEEETETIEHPVAAANENQVAQLSERVRFMGHPGGHEPVETRAEAAPSFVPHIQTPPVHASSAYLPQTFAAPAQHEIPKKVEPVVEVPAQQSYTPPPMQPSAPVKPPQPAAFNLPQNTPVERPNIPLRPNYTPNIPAQPAAPTTQRIAERLAQQRMEGYWQVPPAVEQHPAPVVEEHTAPSIEKHATPVVEQRVAHIVEEHVPTVVEHPAAPVIERPAAHLVEQPLAPVVERILTPVAEKPATPPQPAFVSKPFHPESYFTSQPNKAAEPVIQPEPRAPEPVIQPEPRAAVPAVEHAVRVPEPVHMHEPTPTPIVEVESPVAQPSEVETPRAHKSEVISTPRYAEPAAPVQERAVESVTHSIAQTHPPAEPHIAPHREDVTSPDVQLAEQLDEQQATQRFAAQQSAVQAAAQARANSEQIAQRVAAQAQQARERPRETPTSNLPARITSGNERPSGLMRTLSALRSAMPIVQRLLPLLEGNVAKAVTNLLAPQHHDEPAPPPVDLVPVQRGLVEIQKQHRELREQIATQNVSLQRVEDQLSHVATATDRNTREQQELVEEIQLMGKRHSRFSTIAIILLLLSIAANVVIFLLMKHIL